MNETKLKMLLVSPPGKVHIYKDGTPAHRKHCTPPLGLAYLAASLNAAKYRVAVLDMLAEGYNKERLIDSDLIYGLDTNDLIDRIEKERPDIIGVSVLFSFVIKNALELCEEIKKKFPNIYIVLGGHHPSAMPIETMVNDAVDFVLVGEAEISIVKLMDALSGLIGIESVPSLYYRQNDKILNTMTNKKPVVEGNGWAWYRPKDSGIPSKLDDLPRPLWEIFPMDTYWASNVRIGGGDVVRSRNAVMLSSRGCPHVCFFCSSALTSGYKGFRLRDLDEVVKEIRWLKDTYDVQEIDFLEDNFFASKTRVRQVLERFALEFGDSDLIFSAPGGTEVNKLDKEIIDLMVKARFFKVLIAIESGDQEMQDSRIDKKVELDRVFDVVGYLKEKKIEVRALYMIGFPGEKKSQIMKTIELAKSLPVDDFYISIVTAVPGTPMYDECVRDNLFVEGYDVGDIRFSASRIKLPDTTAEELESLRRNTWLEAFEARRKAMNREIETKHKKFDSIGEYERVGFVSLGNVVKNLD